MAWTLLRPAAPLACSEESARALSRGRRAVATAASSAERTAQDVQFEPTSPITGHLLEGGYVRTPLVERQIAAQARAHGIAEGEVVEKVLLRESAIKRLIEPDEVAEMALYLCSPAASFATGGLLHHGRRLDSPLTSPASKHRPC